jgi:hypothetical protein
MLNFCGIVVAMLRSAVDKFMVRGKKGERERERGE